MIFFTCYDSLLQVPFCEDESVQLFRVAFFRSDFFQNPYFSSLMLCPFTGPKMFWAGPNILRQTKRWFAFSKIGFCSDTNVFEEAPNAVKFLGCLKKFGPAHNIWLHTHLHIYQVIFKILLTSQHPTHCGRKIKNLGLRVILTKRVAAAANRGTTDRKLEELYGAIFCKLARK